MYASRSRTRGLIAGVRAEELRGRVPSTRAHALPEDRCLAWIVPGHGHEDQAHLVRLGLVRAAVCQHAQLGADAEALQEQVARVGRLLLVQYLQGHTRPLQRDGLGSCVRCRAVRWHGRSRGP